MCCMPSLPGGSCCCSRRRDACSCCHPIAGLLLQLPPLFKGGEAFRPRFGSDPCNRIICATAAVTALVVVLNLLERPPRTQSAAGVRIKHCHCLLRAAIHKNDMVSCCSGCGSRHQHCCTPIGDVSTAARAVAIAATAAARALIAAVSVVIAAGGCTADLLLPSRSQTLCLHMAHHIMQPP